VADARRAALAFALVLGAPANAGGAPIRFLVAEPAGSVSHGDSYVLVLEADADIAHARALVAAAPLPDETIVVATIAAGADGVNRDHRAAGAPEWSWHVTAFSEFAESTIELCDGWPSFVEEDVGSWIDNTGGTICFWTYTVVEELPEPGAPALLAAGAALLLALRLKRRAGVRDTLSHMRGKRRIAWLLLALFALQAGGSAAAIAAGPDCCPAMAAASSETPAPAPCRTLSRMGCCEQPGAASSPAAPAPPVHALPVPGATAAVCDAPRVRPTTSPSGESASRSLRSTILRL
jgi:hypothetical protein